MTPRSRASTAARIDEHATTPEDVSKVPSTSTATNWHVDGIWSILGLDLALCQWLSSAMTGRLPQFPSPTSRTMPIPRQVKHLTTRAEWQHRQREPLLSPTYF